MRKDGTLSTRDIRKTEGLNIRLDAQERAKIEKKAERADKQ